MKTITTILVLFCSINLIYAQKAKPSKEETVKYISDLYSKGSEHTYKPSSYPAETTIKGLSVTLDGKTLNVKFNDSKVGDKSYRISLVNVALPLEVEYTEGSYGETFYYHSYYSVKIRNGKSILSYFSLKDDAERIKNALEHLIKIVQSEPDDDPFAP